MIKWHGGKGSRQRDLGVSQEIFDANFEAIFGEGRRKKQGEGDDRNREGTLPGGVDKAIQKDTKI